MFGAFRLTDPYLVLEYLRRSGPQVGEELATTKVYDLEPVDAETAISALKAAALENCFSLLCRQGMVAVIQGT